MKLCENSGRCGGCFYQGISYEEELGIKEQEIHALLEPVIRSENVQFEAIVPSPIHEGYRNKMEFSFGDSEKDGPLRLGLHQKRSFYNIIDTDDCLLPHPDFGLILRETREYFKALSVPYFHKRTHQGYLRHLLVRRAIRTGEILVDLVTSSQKELLSAAGLEEETLLRGWRDRIRKLERNPEDGKEFAGRSITGKLAGILHTRNDSIADKIQDDGTEVLYGESCFYEELLGLRFQITPFSFFQTNSLGAEKLYSKIREYADLEKLGQEQPEGKKPVIYDLYSGTGTITQLMSPAASLAVGVEIVPEAVEAARENARRNGIENCAFIAGDVLKVIQEGGQLLREDGTPQEAPRPDFIVLDPPRDGIHPKALRKIMDYGVERLIYVACKPSSLARDLVPLQMDGYEVERICPVDMFPRTNNCEVVALLSRKK